MNFQGIIPACVTPFIDDVADADAMQANITRWLASGVHGVLIFGSTGEWVYLEPEERRTVLQAARAATPTDKLLLAGCGAESTRRTLRNLEEAAQDGADAALVVTPVYYTRGKTEAQRTYFETLAEKSPLPILLYTVPPFTAYDLPLDLILDLAQHPNISGIKDSSANLTRVVTQVQAHLPDFAIFCGSPNLVFPALSLGVDGSITAFGNVIPEIMVALWQAVQAGDLQGAAELQACITELSGRIRPFGIPALKAILNHRGYSAGSARAPLLPLSLEDEVKVIRAWEHAMQRAAV